MFGSRMSYEWLQAKLHCLASTETKEVKDARISKIVRFAEEGVISKKVEVFAFALFGEFVRHAKANNAKTFYEREVASLLTIVYGNSPVQERATKEKCFAIFVSYLRQYRALQVPYNLSILPTVRGYLAIKGPLTNDMVVTLEELKVKAEEQLMAIQKGPQLSEEEIDRRKKCRDSRSAAIYAIHPICTGFEGAKSFAQPLFGLLGMIRIQFPPNVEGPLSFKREEDLLAVLRASFDEVVFIMEEAERLKVSLDVQKLIITSLFGYLVSAPGNSSKLESFVQRFEGDLTAFTVALIKMCGQVNQTFNIQQGRRRGIHASEYPLLSGLVSSVFRKEAGVASFSNCLDAILREEKDSLRSEIGKAQMWIADYHELAFISCLSEVIRLRSEEEGASGASK